GEQRIHDRERAHECDAQDELQNEEAVRAERAIGEREEDLAPPRVGAPRLPYGEEIPMILMRKRAVRDNPTTRCDMPPQIGIDDRTTEVRSYEQKQRYIEDARHEFVVYQNPGCRKPFRFECRCSAAPRPFPCPRPPCLPFPCVPCLLPPCLSTPCPLMP